MKPAEKHANMIAELVALEKAAEIAARTPAQHHAAVLDALTEADAAAEAAGIAAGSLAWTAIVHSDGTGEVGIGPLRTIFYNEGTNPAAMAVHVAAHDPDTVRALLAARRRILERHAPHSADSVGYSWCGHHRPSGRDPWPCDDYRDAAGDLLPALEDF